MLVCVSLRVCLLREQSLLRWNIDSMYAVCLCVSLSGSVYWGSRVYWGETLIAQKLVCLLSQSLFTEGGQSLSRWNIDCTYAVCLCVSSGRVCSLRGRGGTERRWSSESPCPRSSLTPSLWYPSLFPAGPTWVQATCCAWNISFFL